MTNLTTVAEVDSIAPILVADATPRLQVIGDVKQKSAMRVYEPRREDLVYANVVGSNGGPLRPDALRRIYERIIDEMRTLQRDRMAGQPAKGGQA
mgnify:CR=1 FL=1